MREGARSFFAFIAIAKSFFRYGTCPESLNPPYPPFPKGGTYRNSFESPPLKKGENGDRSLNLLGNNGTPRVVLGLKNDKQAALGLFDRHGKTRAALLDEPSLILLKEGKPVRTLP